MSQEEEESAQEIYVWDCLLRKKYTQESGVGAEFTKRTMLWVC